MRTALIALLAGLAAGCTFAPPRYDPGLPGVPATSSDVLRDPFVSMVLEAIRAEFGSWARAIRREPGRPIRGHYSADAFIVQPGAGFLKGGEAAEAFDRALATRTNDGDLSILDVEVSDGIAYVYGGYLFQTAIAGTHGSTGRHVTVLRRLGADTWRIRTQVFRADPPGRAFPGVAESEQPSVIDMGETASGQSARPVFFTAVTLLAALSRWWDEDNSAALADMFAPNALLQLPGDETPARGAGAIRTSLETALARHGALHTLELDFTSSGRLAVIAGRHLLEQHAGEDRAGFYVLVLSRIDQNWYVRALVID